MFTAGLHNATIPPEVDPWNFAPYVDVPVLMLNGQFDCIFPVDVSQKPLYQAIGSKEKNLIRYESGHILPVGSSRSGCQSVAGQASRNRGSIARTMKQDIAIQKPCTRTRQ